MKISIVVPVYKVEGCLERCVSSLREQTYPDIEIILVDDGSPDTCPEMCDSFAEADPRIKVIHKENGGLSDARNKGFLAAKGEYIMFVDSDDYIELDACEKFLEFLDTGADIIMGDCEVTRPGYAHKHYPTLKVGEALSGAEYMKCALSKRAFPVMVWLNLYRREFLLQNELFFKKGVLHEDTEFTPRANLLAKSVVYSGILFYHYIINDTSITSRKDKRKNCADMYSTAVSLCELVQSLPDRKLRRLIENHLVSCYLSIFRSGDLYTYGKEFVHKKFALKYAHTMRVKMKALLFAISPRLFCKI